VTGVRAAALWFGVLGAPLAWAILLTVGYSFEEVACSEGSSHWGFDAKLGNVLLFAATAAVAVAAAGAALLSWRRAQRPGSADVRGRLEWMGFSGILVSGLFLALILMTGFGITALEPCRH
jgi:hypothetical protein